MIFEEKETGLKDKLPQSNNLEQNIVSAHKIAH